MPGLKKEFGKKLKKKKASEVFIRREEGCGEKMGELREK